MKKLLVILFLLTTAIYVQAQNPIIQQGVSAITYMAGSSTAASSDSIEVGPANTYLKLNGEWDWSIHIVPMQYGTLTADSVYATVKLLFTNLDNDDYWGELEKNIPNTGISGGGSFSFFPYRDTITNTTVALTKGLYMEGKDFTGKRMKVEINRPQTTDSVAYKLYYVFKLHQEQSRP